jgi:hypothetical protein
MVHPDEISAAQGRRPFRPFVMHTADGRSFRVGHPELMFLTRNGRTVVFESVAGHVELLDTVLISSIAMAVEPEEGPARSD